MKDIYPIKDSRQAYIYWAVNSINNSHASLLAPPFTLFALLYKTNTSELTFLRTLAPLHFSSSGLPSPVSGLLSLLLTSCLLPLASCFPFYLHSPTKTKGAQMKGWANEMFFSRVCISSILACLNASAFVFPSPKF